MRNLCRIIVAVVSLYSRTPLGHVPCNEVSLTGVVCDTPLQIIPPPGLQLARVVHYD